METRRHKLAGFYKGLQGAPWHCFGVRGLGIQGVLRFRVYGFGSRGVGVVRFGFRVFLGFGDLGWVGLRQLEHDMLVKQEGGVRAVHYCWPFFRTRWTASIISGAASSRSLHRRISEAPTHNIAKQSRLQALRQSLRELPRGIGIPWEGSSRDPLLTRSFDGSCLASHTSFIFLDGLVVGARVRRISRIRLWELGFETKMRKLGLRVYKASK